MASISLNRIASLRQILASLALVLFSPTVFAQTPGGNEGDDGPPGNYEFGFHLGQLLPNQIEGVSEIMSLGGVRGGMRIAKQGWFEAGFMMGNEDDQTWREITTSIRMDIPVENLVGIASIGLDVLQYRGPGQSLTFGIGGFAGGGIQTSIGGPLLFRAEMLFGFNPGTTLYLGFGFTYRLGEGGGS